MGNGYIREYPVPAGNRYGYGFLPVAGNEHRFRYVTYLAGMDIQSHYPWIIYLLPSLIVLAGHAR
jgi:hypothetical protein